MKGPRAQFGVVAERRGLALEQVLDDLAGLGPGGPAKTQKRIQCAFIKDQGLTKFRRTKMPTLFQHGQIENELADGHSDSRRALRRFENPEGQILDREMRVGGDFDKRFHSRAYRRFSPRKSSRGSSKLQLPSEVTSSRCSTIRSVVTRQSRQANEWSVKEKAAGSSSSSISSICFSAQSCSSARTAAPSTLRKPCIFV